MTYHPFVENLQSKKVYVTKKDIKALPDFLGHFPKDIDTYEMWKSMLLNCYENQTGGGQDGLYTQRVKI